MYKYMETRGIFKIFGESGCGMQGTRKERVILALRL